jgi:hypothetical protein
MRSSPRCRPTLHPLKAVVNRREMMRFYVLFLEHPQIIFEVPGDIVLKELELFSWVIENSRYGSPGRRRFNVAIP